MSVKTIEEIKDFIQSLFPDANISARDSSYLGKSSVYVSIEKSYSFVKLDFSTLMKIAKFCETKDIDVDEWAEGGCPTCDYGSSYTKELQILNLGSWNGLL